MRRLSLPSLGLVLIAGIAVSVIRRRELPPAERGRRLAERTGCFGCHGPGGAAGAQNPGRTDKSVPNFQDDVMMFAKTPQELHEWIRAGGTRKKAASTTWRAGRERGALRM